jgi:hypothetical protein
VISSENFRNQSPSCTGTVGTERMYEKCYVWYAFPKLVIIDVSHWSIFFYFGRMEYMMFVKMLPLEDS